MQENAWLVFYDDLGCNCNYIRAFGPEGSLRPGDNGFDNRLASFMLWESGIYATGGIVEGSDPARGVIRLFNDLGGDGDDGYVRVPSNPPAQRCFSFSCSADRASFVQWSETQEEAWLVFFDDVGCTGNFARVFGPNGKKKLSDLGMDDKVASFMISESGMYPTRGIVDLCYMKDVGSLVEPHKLTIHADDIPSIRGNSTTTGIQFGINGDNNRGTVHASSGK